MDDTAQAQNQNVSDPAQDSIQNPTQPVTAIQQDGEENADNQRQTVPQITPAVQPVGGHSKEHAPIVSAPVPVEESRDEEYITPTEQAPELPVEVKEAGVEHVPDQTRVQLTTEHAAVGIEHAKDTVPVQTTPTGKITFPITKEEIKQVHKQYSWKDSFRWFFDLVAKEEAEKKLAEKKTE